MKRCDKIIPIKRLARATGRPTRKLREPRRCLDRHRHAHEMKTCARRKPYTKVDVTNLTHLTKIPPRRQTTTSLPLVDNIYLASILFVLSVWLVERALSSPRFTTYRCCHSSSRYRLNSSCRIQTPLGGGEGHEKDKTGLPPLQSSRFRLNNLKYRKAGLKK